MKKMKRVIFDDVDFDNDLLDMVCETMNIDVGGEIIAIVDANLWNGRRNGYQLVGDNLRNILSCGGNGNYDRKIWFDGKDLKGDFAHHDGTHHIVFRKVKKGVSIDRLCKNILRGEDVSRQTTSLRRFVKNLNHVDEKD